MFMSLPLCYHCVSVKQYIVISDTGVMPVLKKRSNTEEDLMNLPSDHSSERRSPNTSVDLEWDTEFTAAEDIDTQNLLSEQFLTRT